MVLRILLLRARRAVPLRVLPAIGNSEETEASADYADGRRFLKKRKAICGNLRNLWIIRVAVAMVMLCLLAAVGAGGA